MPSSKVKYDRATLENFIDQYLKALAKNDPSGLPLAKNVRFVEQNLDLKLGEGSWKTVTGLGAYRHYFDDLEMGQTAVITVVEENKRKVILNLRLKISAGKISEIESQVVRDYMGAENYEKSGTPPPIFLQAVPVERRKSRERVIATANQYFTGMILNDLRGDYSFFGRKCDRMEDGRLTTNAPALEYGHSTDKDFVTMSAREQFETGFLGFVTRIRDRRFFVVDEERQSVISFAYYDHNAKIRNIEMPGGKNFVIPPYFSTPRTLECCESFKIENDQIQFIEVTMCEFPYGMRPAWDTEMDPWLREVVPAAGGSRKSGGKMTRAQLSAFADKFLAGLTSRSPYPEGIPAAIKYTENGQRLNIWDGLWGTASEIDKAKTVLADPETNSVAVMVPIKEYNVDSFLIARLKVQNDEAAEIEALVMRHEFNDARMGTMSLMCPKLEGMYKPGDCNDLPGAFGKALPPGERIDAKTMESLVKKTGSDIRERHTLVTDVENGVLLEMTFSDLPNPNTQPPDPAYTGAYSVMRAQLHKFNGRKIVETKSVKMAVPYKMGRGW